ncbi:hypothetical protein FIU87_01390 [Bacillus sp. THAF10]|uniref:hypothetical protein n=1 Tax=Bacillus sp. THAF10 TaxID=2587848 RepID=UPI00126805F8|nr:hypothetical protein [Bacillus sp. THAF10]QFT87306.1 hypothetical protein FIU87_01390 [Bacillus sp. THAF10]
MKMKILYWSAFAFIISCILAGGSLGVYLIGRKDGIFDMELLRSVFTGTFGGVLFVIIISFLVRKKKNKTNIPTFDERNILMMKRYFLGALYFVLVGSGAVLMFLVFMGVETVETGMLALYLVLLFALVGTGAFVTSKL